MRSVLVLKKNGSLFNLKLKEKYYRYIVLIVLIKCIAFFLLFSVILTGVTFAHFRSLGWYTCLWMTLSLGLFETCLVHTGGSPDHCTFSYFTICNRNYRLVSVFV